jgi:flagellar biosynthesis/type III secretory pathway protein FliH
MSEGNSPPRPMPHGAIIKRHEIENWSNAAEAHQAAIALYNSAQEHVQQSVQSEGERGYQHGYAAGVEAGGMQVAEHLVRLNEEFKSNTTHLAQAFPQMVLECVTRIIGTMKPTVVMRKIVEEGLKELNAPTGFTLKIPAGVPTEQFTDLLNAHHKAGNPVINMEVDDTLEPTQTQLISRSGIINLGIEDQLRTLRELLAPSELDAQNGN